MIRRSVLAIVISASTLAPLAAHASFFPSNNNATAQPKVKMIKLTLHNSTKAPMMLFIDDKPVTIAADGRYALSAPEGTRVMGEDKTVKVVVTKDLNGGTCSFAN
jgi:hypothetical protein